MAAKFVIFLALQVAVILAAVVPKHNPEDSDAPLGKWVVSNKSEAPVNGPNPPPHVAPHQHGAPALNNSELSDAPQPRPHHHGHNHPHGPHHSHGRPPPPHPHGSSPPPTSTPSDLETTLAPATEATTDQATEITLETGDATTTPEEQI